MGFIVLLPAPLMLSIRRRIHRVVGNVLVVKMTLVSFSLPVKRDNSIFHFVSLDCLT